MNDTEKMLDLDPDSSGKETIPADPSVKNFCHVVINGEIYQRVDSEMLKKEFPKTTAERVIAMIEMRQLTRHILDIQLADCSDEELQRNQAVLNRRYDSFYKKYGAINSKYNQRLFGDDADFPLLSSIEEMDEDENITKAAIFNKRTIAQDKTPDHVDTAAEALSICLNERGYIDIGFMSGLTRKSNEQIIEDLRGVIFKNPVLTTRKTNM